MDVDDPPLKLILEAGGLKIFYLSVKPGPEKNFFEKIKIVGFVTIVRLFDDIITLDCGNKTGLCAYVTFYMNCYIGRKPLPDKDLKKRRRRTPSQY
jgi:hypothetical protein